MKEHPFLFKAPMVRALLAGTKTQTRRIVTSRNSVVEDGTPWAQLDLSRATVETGSEACLHVPHVNGYTWHRVRCRVAVGDHLWGRETWCVSNFYDGVKPSELPGDGPGPGMGVAYPATDRHEGLRKRPAIHMPRRFSRILREVTEVRAQRVQDISEEDAIAEGVRAVTKDGKLTKYCIYDRHDHSSTPWADMPRMAIAAFRVLWDSINAERDPWPDNPLVWAYTFRRLEQ
jgi:hypothetical protein